MVYLKDKQFMHGNLRCNNLLVSSGKEALVSDFGFAFHRSALKALSKKLQSEELQWKAPECIRSGENPIFKSDVYSLGMCIIEAWTGDVPWGKDTTDDMIMIAAEKEESVFRPVGMPDSVWSLVEKMTRSDPSDRITIDDASAELHKLALEEAKNVQTACADCKTVFSDVGLFCSICGAPRNQPKSNENAKVVELSKQLEPLLALCEATQENQLLCIHVHDRIQEVLTQFKRMDGEDGGLTDDTVVSSTIELVKNYSAFIEKLLAKKDGNILEQLVMHREILTELKQFHLQIDILVTRLNIGEMYSWKKQWSLQHEIAVKSLHKRVISSSNLLEKVANLEGALQQLELEMDRCHGQKHLPSMQSLRDNLTQLLNSVYTVEITLVRATDLAAADRRKGTSDPYTVFTIGSDTLQSKRIDRNLNPVWDSDQRFKFAVSRKSMNDVNVEVRDHDTFKKDDLIGTARIPLTPFFGVSAELAHEKEYSLSVPEIYAQQNRQSKLYLKVTVSSGVVAP